MSGTVYNVQLSPREVLSVQEDYAEKVAAAQEGKGKMPATPEPTNELIASGLAQILGLDEEDILKRLEKRQFRSSMRSSNGGCGPEEEAQVRQFIVDNGLSGLHLPAPHNQALLSLGSSLAAQVIGWVNWTNDGKGAYGMEAIYEEELAGEAGRVVTAKNGKGTEMLYRYEDYYDATDGNDLNLTIDATIQYYCERILAEGH